MSTCDFEITLTGDNESESAYCGLPVAHVGAHGAWRGVADVREDLDAAEAHEDAVAYLG